MTARKQPANTRAAFEAAEHQLSAVPGYSLDSIPHSIYLRQVSRGEPPHIPDPGNPADAEDIAGEERIVATRRVCLGKILGPKYAGR